MHWLGNNRYRLVDASATPLNWAKKRTMERDVQTSCRWFDRLAGIKTGSLAYEPKMGGILVTGSGSKEESGAAICFK
ncbi:hypothetical protein MRX96_054335 [Rhipicephalus microplus]